MKKKFEDFTQEDLWSLRQQIVLGSIYIGHYRNTFGIEADSVCTFFDSFLEYAKELEKEAGLDNEPIGEFYDRYDKSDILWEWYCMYEDFSWVKYEEEEEKV